MIKRLRALRIHAGQLDQVVHRELGQLLLRVHALRRQHPRGLAVHALERQQVRCNLLDLLFAGDRLHQQRVAGPAAQLVHGVLVELLDLQHLVDRNIGDLLQRVESFLHQDVGHLLVHVELLHEQRLDRGGFLFVLLLGLFLGHDVELPAGHLARQPHVLPAAADRLRQVLLVHDDVHAVPVFVDDDAADFGRRQRIDHELGGIRRPQDDVDALAGELGGHGLDPGAAHADAGADRIDARVVGLDRDLGARARIAGRRLDLQQPFLDLRNLQLEQLDQKLGDDARQDQLRPAAAAVDLQQEGAHAVADAQVLLRDHLIARQHRLDAAGLDDRVAALDALDRAGDQMLLARQEVVQDLLALGIADLLQDDLLGGLRADAAELDRLERLFDVFVELECRAPALARLLERASRDRAPPASRRAPPASGGRNR